MLNSTLHKHNISKVLSSNTLKNKIKPVTGKFFKEFLQYTAWFINFEKVNIE